MFITWAVSDRVLIGQFLELAFQMIFAGVIRIRHGGCEESIDAVRRQSVLGVCEKDNSAFSERFDLSTTKLTLNTLFLPPGKMPYNRHLWAVLLAKSLLVSSRC